VLALLALGLTCVGASPAGAEPSSQPMEILPGSFSLTPSSFQSGAHADWTLRFDLARSTSGKTRNDLRSTVVNYPAGFVGNSLAVPTCTVTQLLAQGPPEGRGALCPPASQVGVITLTITVHEAPEVESFPVYNMELTTFGVAAELGFKTAIITQLLPVTVRPQDSGLTGRSEDIKELAEPHAVSLTVWGVPAAHEHDPLRGQVCEESGAPEVVECQGGGEEAKERERPMLANPSACGTVTESMKADSWEEPQPEDWFTTPVAPGPRSAFAEAGPFVECERVPFTAAMQIHPTTASAESASGLEVSLEVPQDWQEPTAIATSNVKDVTVTLPRGYTVNPADGNGLAGCTPQQYASETAFSAPGAGCPLASKLGTVEITTPVLAEKLTGNVYLAQPYDNPFSEPGHPGGSLLALYVVAKAPDRGVIVKSAGKVSPDPVTGQLTSSFEGLPQQPFTVVSLKLHEGATSPLASPPLCGSYGAQAQLTPYSAPATPRLASNALQIETGIGGGPCPAGGAPPFHPQVISGTQSNAAGSYSPFYLRIVRDDGEQELTRFSTTLPPGLTGNLTGIPFCPDATIEAARSRTGNEELQSPSCPAASKVGHTLVGAGVGSVLAQTPGSLYLAGPYHGAPLSLVSITSATVGPFDLGTVVIRFALRINPITAQVEVDATGSDPIPHNIKGIVTHVRDIRAYIDRPNFMINPTSCEHLAISNVITGAGADPSNPADQAPVAVSSPFQAADCASLKFNPGFQVSTTGKTSKQNGASLVTKLTFPNAPQGTQANITKVKVELPKQLPSRLTTLQKACLASVFEANPASCPAGSIVGMAKAVTPVLPVPLSGPAYFVSYGSAKFPELVIVLQGYGITVNLHAETFIDKHGVTSSTFNTVPDVPVGTFELTLPQGPFSALAANTNLCSLTTTTTVKRKVTQRVHGHTVHRTVTTHVKKPASLLMPTFFYAQNGAQLRQNTKIAVTGCPRPKKAKKARKPARKARKHR
jgi:hypothetical protein